MNLEGHQVADSAEYDPCGCDEQDLVSRRGSSRCRLGPPWSFLPNGDCASKGKHRGPPEEDDPRKDLVTES